jgi:peptidoglycan/xylan/chitin deacetylase (PgdA/CDA1 family)
VLATLGATAAACSRSTVGQVLEQGKSLPRPAAPVDQPLPPANFNYPPLSVNCAIVPCVSLTFDDGPDDEHTPEVLRILARESVKATFFVVGHLAAEFPEQIRMMVADGHEVGNHSWDHPNLTTLSPDEITNQVERTNAAIKAAGAPPPRLFRAPYGATTDWVCEHIPMPLVNWDVDPNDWEDNAHPVAVTNHILGSSTAGSIVLLHSINPTTVEALPDIIAGLRAGGYELVPVSVLTEFPENSAGQIFDRRWEYPFGAIDMILESEVAL